MTFGITWPVNFMWKFCLHESVYFLNTEVQIYCMKLPPESGVSQDLTRITTYTNQEKHLKHRSYFAKHCNGNAATVTHIRHCCSYSIVDFLILYVTFKWWNFHQRVFIITRCLCFSPSPHKWRLQFLLDGSVARQGDSPHLI